MEMVAASCVMVHVTLSAPAMRGDRPWLFVLSRVQVPAKLAAALLATTAKANAVISPAIKKTFLILKSSVKVCDSLVECDLIASSVPKTYEKGRGLRRTFNQLSPP